jgi:hypothetical protein
MILITDYLLYDLIENFPSYNIQPFPIRGNVPDFVLVMPPQGNESRYYTNGLFSASLVIQGTDSRTALEQATAIYNRYRDQVNYTMTLPVDYEPLNTQRTLKLQYIQPVDRPVPLGDVGNGRYQYSLNFLMTIGGL